MKKDFVIDSCYTLLDSVTPLYFDCGKLCNGKCCKGDEKTGMLLFPGEEAFLDENINIVKNDDGSLVAVCNGTCNRAMRPLSCRIYPLFPIIKNENGVEYIEVIFDPRADCPLAEGKVKFERRFVKAVKRVGKYLLANEETEKVYREISDEINDIMKLHELFSR